MKRETDPYAFIGAIGRWFDTVLPLLKCGLWQMEARMWAWSFGIGIFSHWGNRRSDTALQLLKTCQVVDWWKRVALGQAFSTLLTLSLIFFSLIRPLFGSFFVQCHAAFTVFQKRLCQDTHWPWGLLFDCINLIAMPNSQNSSGYYWIWMPTRCLISAATAPHHEN